MNIVILNGSPKGEKSVTMQYVKFLQKHFSDHKYKYLNIGNRINTLEKDESLFEEWIGEIEKADLVLFAFPLYVFLVSSQFKRFIELIYERNVEKIFNKKATAILTTSINFFDHTAINYIEGICNDLDMDVVDKISIKMHDLFQDEKRGQILNFGDNIFYSINNNIYPQKRFSSVIWSDFKFSPETSSKRKLSTTGKRVVILSDNKIKNSNLEAMVNSFSDNFDKVEIYNINEIGISAGCQGCLRCGWDNTCLFEGKDDFISFYRNNVVSADILIFAGKITDRYLSSRWKMFFDRRFFNTHQPTMSNKQLGFIIEGPLSQLPNLREILEGYVQWEKANMLGFVTDEETDSSLLSRQLNSFAEKSLRFSEKKYVRLHTFLGVGGLKVFRDDMFADLRFPFVADHKYYKKNGIYNFSNRKVKFILINKIMILVCTLFPSFRKTLYQKMIKDKMIEPYQSYI